MVTLNNFIGLKNYSLLISPSYLYDNCGCEFTQETQQLLIKNSKLTIVIDLKTGVVDVSRLHKKYSGKMIVGLIYDFFDYEAFINKLPDFFPDFKKSSGKLTLKFDGKENQEFLKRLNDMYDSSDFDNFYKYVARAKFIFNNPGKDELDNEFDLFIFYNIKKIKKHLPKRFDVLYLNLGDFLMSKQGDWSKKKVINELFKKAEALRSKVLILTLGKYEIGKGEDIAKLIYDSAIKLKFKEIAYLDEGKRYVDYTVTKINSKEQFLNNSWGKQGNNFLVFKR